MATAEQDVLGLDVTMHNTVGVRLGHGINHVPENAHGVANWQLPFFDKLVPNRRPLMCGMT
jgi:hypothetical protein